MRSRRWVSWIAIAGMLLHAATIARHNVILFKQTALAQVAASTEVFAPGALCHGGGPVQKSPAGAPKPCPICLGLASAHGLPASEVPVLRVPQTVIALAFIPGDRQPAQPAGVRFPPNRGPPSIA